LNSRVSLAGPHTTPPAKVDNRALVLLRIPAHRERRFWSNLNAESDGMLFDRGGEVVVQGGETGR